MSSPNPNAVECPENHSFKDFCDVSEHNGAFVASHLGNPIKGGKFYKESYSKDKIKTINVALVVCLNMDVDPPDVQKIPPFSRIEAWVDPADAGFRVIDMIGKNLQAQYERWQPKGCYRQCLDPNLEEVKKICVNMRRNARQDRILFHYNGHGVPRPTENGEIWVFNRTFTKYIPLSLFDLQRWLGGPSVIVADCQNAGRILRLYEYFCQRRMKEGFGGTPGAGGAVGAGGLGGVGVGGGGVGMAQQMSAAATAAGMAGALAPATMENTIMLCACEENEDLPQLAELPADLFTACLTTPIRTALIWHWMKYNKAFPGHVDESMLYQIPGTPGNRMSLLGEINWIFTAITDTIAWCSFPVEVFQRLFRQDLLVASLFRNYLLAQRLMRAFGCHPVSWPTLAPTHDHQMWSAWDHALDLLFYHLPQVLDAMHAGPTQELALYQQRRAAELASLPLVPPAGGSDPSSPLPASLSALTNEEAKNITALLQDLDRQLREATQGSGGSGGGEAKDKQQSPQPQHQHQKRRSKGSRAAVPAQAPPPGYEETVGPGPPATSRARAHHHNSGNKAAKFHVEASALGHIQEGGDGGSGGGVATNPPISSAVAVAMRANPVAGGRTKARLAGPHSCPSHLPHRDTVRGQQQPHQHHHQHHHARNPQPGTTEMETGTETDYTCSDTEEDEDDVELDDDDLEEEEDEMESDLEDEEEEEEDESETDSPEEETGQEQALETSEDTSSHQHQPQQQQQSQQAANFNVYPPAATASYHQSQAPASILFQQELLKNFQQHHQQTQRPPTHLDYLNSRGLAPDQTAPAPSRRGGITSSLFSRVARAAASKAPQTGPPPIPLVQRTTSLPEHRPSAFFTSQMTAFQDWLRQASSSSTAVDAEEKTAEGDDVKRRQSATQLPILLQVLLSQTHRIRALQLLSEFLDLGPWAVSHCITVGILPYIVRLFHSNVLEVKPHLVFIWAKIIAAARIDFARHEGIRESGYRYFVACAQDATNLSPLVRTMAVFALAKMLIRGDAESEELLPQLVPDADFQRVYFTAKPVSFIQVAAEGLIAASSAGDGERLRHMKVWLLLALGRLWLHYEEARWFAAGRVLEAAVFPQLQDPDPVVRAAAVYALGTLIEQPEGFGAMAGEGRRNLQETDGLCHQVGLRLLERTRDPAALVRCEVVVALRNLVVQFYGQVLEHAHAQYLRPILDELRPPPPPTATTGHRTSSYESSRTVGSGLTAAGLIRGMAELGLTRIGRAAHSHSHRNLREAALSSSSTSPSSAEATQLQEGAEHARSVPTFVEDFEPNVPENIFAQLLDMVVVLAADPHPSVADLANSIFHFIVDELLRRYNVQDRVVVIDGQLYLRRRPNATGDGEEGVAPLSTSSSRTLAASPNALAATMGNSQGSGVFETTSWDQFDLPTPSNPKDMIVRTEFFHWCSRWFSQPLLMRFPDALRIQQPESEASKGAAKDDLPSLPPELNTQCLASLSAISKDPRARSLADHLRRFKTASTTRRSGRRRWHTLVTGSCPTPDITVSSTHDSEESEARHHLRHLLHRSFPRSVSPLSSARRRNVPHTRTLTRDLEEAFSLIPRLGSPSTTKPAVELQLQHVLQRQTGEAGVVAQLAKFHPYKSHLFVAESGGSNAEYAVSVWGVQRGERLSRLTLGQEAERLATLSFVELFAERFKRRRAVTETYDLAQVTSVEILNALEERSLVLTSSRDGCVRVWQNYEANPGTNPQMLTSWVALENQVPLNAHSRTAGIGLVTAWSDCCPRHHLLVSGDVRVVRVFDTDCEARLADFETRANCPVTRLVRASVSAPYLFAAGFADGTVKIFDSRLPTYNAVVFEAACGEGSGRVMDLAFTPYQSDRRIYAVTSSGLLGAWQMEATSQTAEASLEAASHPEWKSIVGGLLEDGPSPIGSIRAAILNVDLPCSRSHFVAYMGSRGFDVVRLHDGRLIASHRVPGSAIASSPPKLVPMTIALHPYKSQIAVGMSDASIHVYKLLSPQ